MRITFITPKPDLSGGIRVIAIYAQRLAARGHDVTIVSTPSPQLQRKSKRLREALLGGRLWRKSSAVAADVKLPSEPSHLDGINVPHTMIDRFRPVTDSDVPDADVVIATWWETAEWVAGLSPRKGAKAYFIQHHEVFDYTPADRVKATWRLPLHKITISKWLVDLAKREYGDTNVRLVLNSVDADQFSAPPRGRQTQPTVGLLYSPVKWKGVDIALKAIATALKRVPNLRVIAFGTTPETSSLPLPKNSTFHLRPPQNTIRDIYASSDVWLCGSYSEGFHLTPLEAMACRCPVVSTSVGGPIDIIDNGRNGFLVPIGDAEALGDRLVEVLTLDNTRWRAMSDAAFETAARYTWDDATDLLENALRDIAGTDPAPKTRGEIHSSDVR